MGELLDWVLHVYLQKGEGEGGLVGPTTLGANACEL
jgi:hypothetical protein